jgi:hypothetical protein
MMSENLQANKRHFTPSLPHFVAIRFSAAHGARNIPLACSPLKGSAMFQQILSHTPAWVWAVFAFLVYRGFRSSVDREMPLGIVLLIPLVMLALSLQGMLASFGAAAPALLAWLACLLAGGLLAWRLFQGNAVAVHRARGTVLLRGSWMPMLLMLGVFLTKYVIGVLLALQPAHARELLFAVTACALYGVFNGLFLGRMLRVLVLWKNP